MNILPRTLLPLLLLLAPLAHAQDGYSYVWWADGLRGHDAQGRRLLNIQTNEYGAVFDVEKATFIRYGKMKDKLSYADAARQDNTTLDALPPASLKFTATVSGVTYTCTGAATNTKDHLNYPVQLIDSGRFLNRFAVLGLEFTAPDGTRLEGEGRLEVRIWPEKTDFTLTYEPTMAQRLSPTFRLALQLSTYTGTSGTENGVADRFTLQMSFSNSNRSLRRPPHSGSVAELHAQDAQASNADLPVQYSLDFDAFTIPLPARQWDLATDLDHFDRYPLTINNPSGEDATYPLVFACDGPFQGVTGLCPMLRDADGNPTGIPVQISKNWHRDKDRRLPHEGPWFHAITEITVPPHGEWKGELAIAYARWGGVPSVSHAQLCLIGYGGNQRWDECAIGSFGESICYDADVGLNRAMIDDVRPLMVTSMDNGKWSWTHNVGGGDFLVYAGPDGQKQYLSGVKTAYLSQGPNLSDVIYAGHSADGKISASIEVLTPRCDDVNRSYHRLRYDVHVPTPFTRLAFYQLGADNYNDHQFTRIARGNKDGLVEEWDPGRGGKKYLREGIPCEGAAPWFALLGGIRSPQLDKGAWADRALVIRAWKARLGGKDIPTPFAAVYGTENGIPSANLELVPPPGLTELLPGDFVEAEVELLILPQRAEDYYGPNAALRADLTANGGTWKTAHRLAAANDLKIEAEKGTLTSRLPIAIVSADGTTAAFTLHGGAGYLPLSITGLKSPTGHTLSVNNTPVDQHIHGNDYWQTDFEPATKTYTLTYNLPTDTTDELHVELSGKN